jgi:hypothetical protein
VRLTLHAHAGAAPEPVPRVTRAANLVRASSSVRARSIGSDERERSGMQWEFDRARVLPAPPALETLADLEEFYDAN